MSYLDIKITNFIKEINKNKQKNRKAFNVETMFQDFHLTLLHTLKSLSNILLTHP